MAAASFTNISFRVKKYLKLMSFSSPSMIVFVLLLERQTDRHTEAGLARGAMMTGTHDAVARAGDDHPTFLLDQLRELDALGVLRVIFLGARRSEERCTLGMCSYGCKDLERVTKLLQRPVEDLQFSPGRIRRGPGDRW
jgi:hypothetical protein